MRFFLFIIALVLAGLSIAYANVGFPIEISGHLKNNSNLVIKDGTMVLKPHANVDAEALTDPDAFAVSMFDNSTTQIDLVKNSEYDNHEAVVLCNLLFTVKQGVVTITSIAVNNSPISCQVTGSPNEDTSILTINGTYPEDAQ